LKIDLKKGDCLKLMNDIPDKSIDMILCDLPYGTTQNKWDSIIPLDKLWEQYCRVIKDNGAIVLFAQTPFDKVLGCSNLKMLKYEWIWEKTSATGHLNAKKMPMKAHENILVFYKKLPTYNPQKTTGHTPVHSYTKHQDDGSNYGKTLIGISGGGSTERYPRSVQVFKTDKQKEALHPTQKPVDLLEYLIKTYTNEGETVLDNTMGSGSTGVAAVRTNRNFVGIELDDTYFEIANKRIKDVYDRAISNH
jgi:DNA modification methylase